MQEAHNGFFISFIPGITIGSALALILQKAAVAATMQEEQKMAPLKEMPKTLATKKYPDGTADIEYHPHGQIGVLIRTEEGAYYLQWAGCTLFENKSSESKIKGPQGKPLKKNFNIQLLILVQLLWTQGKISDKDIELLNSIDSLSSFTEKFKGIPSSQNLPERQHATAIKDPNLQTTVMFAVRKKDKLLCTVILTDEKQKARCPLPGKEWVLMGKLKCVAPAS